MKPSARTVLAALTRGEKISINDSRRLRCGAIGQRISELRAIGVKILDRHPMVEGKRAAWKVYWMEVEAVPPPKTETIVRAHVRRLSNELTGVESPEPQGELFA